MSKLEVDAIEPQSGTTITIGASGDTVNLVGTLQSNGSPLPGDISEVIAGTGLSGGGTTGAVTINIDSAQPTITSLGTITGFTSTGIDDNADATAITINSSEQIAIGTTSFDQDAKLTIVSSGSGGANPSSISANTIATFRRTGGVSHNAMISILGGSSGYSILNLGDRDDEDVGRIIYEHSNNSMQFHTDQNERMRITSAGLVGIGTSSPSSLLSLEASSPDIMFTDTSGGTDSKKWRVFGLDSDFRIGCRNDANNSGQTALQISRSGATITDQRFSTNGTERMRIDSSGNVSIGTTVAIATLNVLADSGSQGIDVLGRSSDNRSRIQLSSNNGTTTYSQWDYNGTTVELKAVANVPLVFRTNNTEQMRIDNSGNVGIGESSPGYNLVVDGGANTTIRVQNDTPYYGDFQATTSGIQIRTIGSYPLILNTNQTERMRIDSSGNVLFNTTGIPNGTSIYGSAFVPFSDDRARLYMAVSSTGARHIINFYNPNGSVGRIETSGSATTYATSSDYRLKENVSYDFDATTRLKQLKPARFNFIADANTTVDGFLAHEVQDIVPEAISGEKDAVNEDGSINPQGIDQAKLVPLLVKTIQELEARITTLENA